MIDRLSPEFVVTVPDELEEGTLYVSMAYGTAIHLCACGCGDEVVTPISPSDWQLAYDGEGISLTPSIGNWRLDCRSHYWIRSNRVDWAPDSGAPAGPIAEHAQEGQPSVVVRVWRRVASWLHVA